MGWFYRPTSKEILEVRNLIIIERGIPAINKNGFIKSPFSSDWYGMNNMKDYTYELCRLRNNRLLDRITIHIVRNEKWIRVILNVFELKPKLKSIDQLNGMDGIQYVLPPNSISEMRLRVDDFRGVFLPFGKKHRLGHFFTSRGFKKSVIELGNLIELDMQNIDSFVNRWHQIHIPIKTNWEGKPITTSF